MVAVRPWVAGFLIAVFAALSVLHVFWALGGRWGSAVAVPEIDGRKTIHPGPAATVAVAGLFALAGVVVALRAGVIPGQLAMPRLLRLASWSLTAVLAMRAAGDFRTFGFLKPPQATDFAHYDTVLFSPICVITALGCALVASS
jgi:hypothetical protein